MNFIAAKLKTSKKLDKLMNTLNINAPGESSRHGGTDDETANFVPPNNADWALAARKFVDTEATLSTDKPEQLYLDFWSDWRTAFLTLQRVGLDRISAKDFHRLDKVDTQIETLKAHEKDLWRSISTGEHIDPVQVRYECEERIRLETTKQNELLTAVLSLRREDLTFLAAQNFPESHPYFNLSSRLNGTDDPAPQLVAFLLAQAQQDYDDASRRKTEEQNRLEQLDDLHRCQKERVEILERLTRRYDILQGKVPSIARRLPENTTSNLATNLSIWVLCIGINKYEKLVPLNGAVKDAEAMKEFFLTFLGVPGNNIRFLADGDATRAGILAAFYDHLRDNPKIQCGDTIVIHYAGHGTSYRAAEVFLDTPASIEAICPVDRGVVVDGQKILDISDREINLFLSELRDAKGNNVTLIMDCCFSGSAARSFSPTREVSLARVAPPLQQTLRDMLNAAELNPRKRWLQGSVLTKSWKPDMTSHVVVAACQDYEKAWETRDGRGAFTAALIDALKALPLNATTYRGLMKHIGQLPRQSPLAAGSRVDSNVFNL